MANWDYSLNTDSCFSLIDKFSILYRDSINIFEVFVSLQMPIVKKDISIKHALFWYKYEYSRFFFIFMH